ncbi:MAG: TonB-dependent receptor [Pseudomonadota bacterium]
MTHSNPRARSNNPFYLRRKRRLSLAVSAALAGILGGLIGTQPALAQPGSEAIEEVIVKARKRDESITDIPDAVTVFTADTIERAGINNVNDFANLTPNLMIREGFRDGVSFITMRGISTAQQGLPPVTVVVDGVQVAALDFINQGLVDIESIEVLRGPQGALYGAGAMAGAINITTAMPSDEMEGRLRVTGASGNDLRLQGVISGPLGDSENWSYRARASYRDFDGVVDNVRGDEVDFDEALQLGGRLLYEGDRLTADFRASFGAYEAGAIEQSRIPARPLSPNDSPFTARHAIPDFTGALFVPVLSIDQTVNDFDGTAFDIQSDFLGAEERDFVNLSMKLDYEFDQFTLTSITSYDDADQELAGDSDWAATDILGIAGAAASGFFPSLTGLTNVTGRAQSLDDDFEAFTQEFRLTSNNNGRFRWLAGAWYQDREARTVLSLPVAQNTNQLGPDFFQAVGAPFPRTDFKNDELWALFGQVNYDISDRLELTVGLRYDDATYDNTGYQCFGCEDAAFLLPSNDEFGNVVNTPEESDDDLQPKVSLSYDWSDQLMTYATYAEGYRPGFFNTGNPTAAESTENIELGFKYADASNRWSLYGAIFRIDYSEQQFSTIIGGPPFRLTTNIPSVDIDGLELEAALRATDDWTLSAGYGYVDAEESGSGLAVPNVPDYTFNLSSDYRFPVGESLDGSFRIDYRRQGSWYLARQELYEVTDRDYLNVRVSVAGENWMVTAFGTNVLEEFQANEFGLIDGVVGFVRSWSGGRQFGLEATWNF